MLRVRSPFRSDPVRDVVSRYGFQDGLSENQLKDLVLDEASATLILQGTKTIVVCKESTEYRGTLQIRSLPTGRILVSCQLVEAVPIVSILSKRDLPPGQSVHSHHTERRLERHVIYGGEMYLCDGHSGQDVTDQLSYGDFAPGFFGWILDDVKPTEVKP